MGSVAPAPPFDGDGAVEIGDETAIGKGRIRAMAGRWRLLTWYSSSALTSRSGANSTYGRRAGTHQIARLSQNNEAGHFRLNDLEFVGWHRQLSIDRFGAWGERTEQRPDETWRTERRECNHPVVARPASVVRKRLSGGSAMRHQGVRRRMRARIDDRWWNLSYPSVRRNRQLDASELHLGGAMAGSGTPAAP